MNFSKACHTLVQLVKLANIKHLPLIASVWSILPDWANVSFVMLEATYLQRSFSEITALLIVSSITVINYKLKLNF